jgi:hypothetical protein
MMMADPTVAQILWAGRRRELRGRGGRQATASHAHLNMLANGHEKPSLRAMALIAQACEVQTEYFAQYRLAAAMRELDPAEVGLEQALPAYQSPAPRC